MRKAFTMIELIFAIVIIAISVMSLPMMTQATARGIDSNLLQEVIFSASTELNQAVTANWDEASLEPGEPFSLARVIDDGSCGSDASLSNYRQMPGHINQPLHRRCLDNNATIISNATADANVISLDDIEKTNEDIFVNRTTDKDSYKDVYLVTVAVANNVIFGTDQVNTNPNIKQIDVSVTYEDGELITSLTTYSSNIGEIDYYKRSYE